MQGRTYYIVVTWVLVVGAMSAGIAYVTEPRESRESSELVSPRYIAEPVAQRQSSRNWPVVNWAEVRSIHDVRVSRPLIMKISHRGDVYVLDWLDLKLHVYASRGDARTIGAGRGFGPGELQNPTDFVIEADGGVWICDPAENRLTHFGPTGVVQATIALPDRSDRLLSTPSGIVLKLSPGNPHVFGLLDESGSISNSWGEIIRDKHDHGLVLDGTFASSDRQPEEVLIRFSDRRFFGCIKGKPDQVTSGVDRWLSTSGPHSYL